MIVQCPACSARYRINSANLPEGGGHIKCPKCSHVFMVKVKPEDQAQAATPEARPAEQPRVARTLALSGINFGAALAAAQSAETPPEDEGSSFEDNPGLADILRSQSEGDALDQLFKSGGGLETSGGADDWSASLPPEFSVAASSDDSSEDPISMLLQDSGARPSVHSSDSPAVSIASTSGAYGIAGDTDTMSEIERLLAETAGEETADTDKAQETAAAASTGEEKWRVKNAIGLHFDFPNLESMRNWLSNRDSHDGYLLTKDQGQTWGEVSEFKELQDVKPRVSGRPTREINLGEAGLQPPAGAPAGAAQRKPAGRAQVTPARASNFQVAAKSSTKRGYLYLVVLLLLVLGLAGAHLAGIITLPWIGHHEIEPVQPLPAERAAEPETAAAEEDEEAADEQEEEPVSMETAATELIMRAESRLAEEDTEGAIQILEQALTIAPQIADIHCRLAPLYATLETGASQAAAAQERCNALREVEEQREAPEDEETNK